MTVLSQELKSCRVMLFCLNNLEGGFRLGGAVGSAVQAAAWVGKIHRTEPGSHEAGRPPGDQGEGISRELALVERGPHGHLHPALLEGPDHRCTARCCGNHTWMMTPVSKAWQRRGRYQRQER